MAERLAGIVRVSSMGGRKAGDANVHADRDQLEAIEGYAQRNKARLHVLPPELDVSGGLALEKRPSLLAAIEGVERGAYDAIVVAYLSRLGRNVREQLRAWDRVEAAGGRIICVQEDLDTSTPVGRYMRTVMLANAEHEREIHVERFNNLRRWATAAGVWQRRQTPRGYSKDPETRRLIPDARADEVRAAFRDFTAGRAPLVALARKLGMTPSGVRQMLRNRVYLGELRVGDELNPDAHQPVIDLDTHQVAQRRLAESARPARPSNDGPALLAGVVRCAGCGHRMSRGRGGSNVVYICPRNHSGEVCPAPAAVTLELLDRHVEPIVSAELARLGVAASKGQTLEQARERLSAAEAELATYIEAVSAADVGAQAFAEGARARREQVDAAQEDVDRELAQRSAIPRIGSGAKAWDQLDAQERNAVVRALLAAVVVRRAGGRGSRTALPDRVRVLAQGTQIDLPSGRGGEALGIVSIPLPDPNDPGVLRVPAGKDSLKRTRSADKVRVAAA